jgi:hypothetical protein
LKRLPQSPELADALRVDDADYIDAAPAPRLSVVQRLKANAPTTGEGFSAAHVERELAAEHDPDTGEIIEAELEPVDDTAEEDMFPGDRPSEHPVVSWGRDFLAWIPSANAKVLTEAWAEAKREGKVAALQHTDPDLFDSVTDAKDRRFDAMRGGR